MSHFFVRMVSQSHSNPYQTIVLSVCQELTILAFLEMCLQQRVDERLKKYTAPGKKSSITVKVTNSMTQKHVVWLGGSSFSAGDHFKSSCHTRAEYQEKGPSCCRFNPVFSF